MSSATLIRALECHTGKMLRGRDTGTATTGSSANVNTTTVEKCHEQISLFPPQEDLRLINTHVPDYRYNVIEIETRE